MTIERLIMRAAAGEVTEKQERLEIDHEERGIARSSDRSSN